MLYQTEHLFPSFYDLIYPTTLKTSKHNTATDFYQLQPLFNIFRNLRLILNKQGTKNARITQVGHKVFFCLSLFFSTTSRVSVLCVQYSTICHCKYMRCLAADYINPLTPNDPYSGRTAPLTSKRCTLYIYSTNTGNEYFKHGVYSSFFLFKMQFVS